MHYTPITLPELQSLLKSEKGWTINSELPGNEFIFEFPLSTKPYIVIRVYSTIRKNDSNCRYKGADAIRIFAFNKLTNSGWIKTRKILRVESWRKNLTDAIFSVFEQAQSRCKEPSRNYRKYEYV